MLEDGSLLFEGKFHPYSDWFSNAALNESCHLCALLLYRAHIDRMKAFLKELADNDNFDATTSVKLEVTVDSVGRDPLRYPIRISILSARYDEMSRGVLMFRAGVREDPEITTLSASNIESSSPENSTTWTSQTIRQISTWLRHCSNEHEECYSSCGGKSSRYLPTRLIDVGVNEESCTSTEEIDILTLDRSPTVRLCSSVNLSKGTKYLTLSHRWDDVPAITLNQSSADKLHKQIPYSRLCTPAAATLKDAIQVTRCLGFRYLWVDVLCIYQDDQDDKIREIRHMNEVYSNSTLNICATATSLASEGLFQKSSPFRIKPCLKPVVIKASAGQVAGELMAYTDHFSDEVDEGPINDRGWVFQERMLAPRTLHFGRSQVYWECSSLQTSATLPLETPPLFSVFGKTFKKWTSTWFSDRACELGDLERTWTTMLTAYSPTLLTHSSDRLVAISALAKIMCMLRGLEPQDYLAGLWRPDLPHQLMWITTEPWASTSELAAYRAPSWSWAARSASTTIWLHEYKRPSLVDIISASVSLKTANPFGEVCDGILQLRGPMCKFMARRLSVDDTFVLTAAGRSYPRDFVITLWDYTPNSPNGNSPRDVVQGILPDILYLMAFQSYCGSKNSDWHSLGLILRPVNGIGCYMRSGFFQMNFRGNDLYEDFCQILNAQTLSRHEYLELSESNKYTIRIV